MKNKTLEERSREFWNHCRKNPEWKPWESLTTDERAGIETVIKSLDICGVKTKLVTDPDGSLSMDVTYSFPDGTTTEQCREVVKRHVTMLDALHRLQGGSGLKINSSSDSAVARVEGPHVS